MNILITGAGGQLSFDLIRVLAPNHKIFALTRHELDITNYNQVVQAVDHFKPHVIIHTAAFTHVDLAESSMETAYQVNAFGTKNVASAAQRIGAKLVYISTDYVFDGKKGLPYTEIDSPSPLGIYGNSKLLGEKFVETFSDRFFIVRTAWLFGRNGQNFVKKMISLACNQDIITVVTDQIGSPTYSLDLSRFIGELIQTENFGIYHAVNKGFCSRFEFTRAILKASGLTKVTLIPASLEQFHLPAPRPVNSAMDDFFIRLNHLPLLRGWESALEEFISQDLPR